MEVVRKYFSAGYSPSMTQIIKITFCRAMVSFSSFFAFMILLSSIVFFTNFHNKLELIVIKGSGISPFQIFKSIAIAVAILGTFYISVFDSLSAYSYKQYHKTNTILKQGKDFETNMTITNKGIWLKDTFDKKSYIIAARGFSQKTSSLFNVRIFEFNESNDYIRLIRAKNLGISDGNWSAKECVIITANGLRSGENSVNLPTKISYKNLSSMVADPREISFWSIGKYINMFSKVGLSTIGYKIHWYSRISIILQMFAFAVVAMTFCVNQNLRDRKAYMIKVAILMALAFPVYFLNNIVMAYGESGVLPIAFSAFAVPILIFVTGILFLKKK